MIMRTRTQNSLLLTIVFLAIAAGILQGLPDACQALSDLVVLR